VTVQVPACDRCTQGVMDATNPHLLGTCPCSCHDLTERPRCAACVRGWHHECWGCGCPCNADEEEL
jgi:hypothetical protein